jgi:predicted dehydrogenase
MSTNDNDLKRREFLGTVSAAAMAGAMAASRLLLASGEEAAAADAPQAGAGYAKWPFSVAPIPMVRIGFVGVGLQGTSHVENLVQIPGCRVTAICDIDDARIAIASKVITGAGHPAPAVYNKGPRDFERLCETEELDLVYTATPWEWHVPVMLAAMKNGKHAATEVPAAMSVEDCWAIVNAAEKYQKHCLLMENCNYDRPEMMVYNIVRQGLLGDVIHAEGAYLHDLRSIKFEDRSEGLWRRAWSTKVNGNLYPTHGLGPIANCLGNNRGDRFDYITSMSGPSRGLQDWRKEHVAADSPKQKEQYICGDVNLSLIKMQSGKTIVVQNSTNLPRPYSRIHLVQGTKGLFMGYPNRLYIEGRSPKSDVFEDIDVRKTPYQHPLWSEIEQKAAGAGHGGMDFIEDWRLIKCLNEGAPTDFNVYDAASISAVVGLSAQSVAKKSEPMPFPDVTRGKWKTSEPWGIVRA